MLMKQDHRRKCMVGALGSKPEAITGIPLKVDREQRAEEPLSLTIVSIIYLGMRVWGLFTTYAIHTVIFCF